MSYPHRATPSGVRHRLVVPASPSAPVHASLPLFLRAPAIAALWGLALLVVVAAIALGHVRVPRVVSGVAVAVQPAADSLTLLLLLPPAARTHLHAGQLATLDTGDAGAFTVTIASVEQPLLDAAAARRRFREPASLLAHLHGPTLVARLERCANARCLTPQPGTSYAATAALGTRSLASYALPRS